ncbi:MAG: hypothetical protein R6X02_01935 [Enhygromyxa sp.]
MTAPSSRDLHPKTGARFVFDRRADEPEPSYEVTIYLPEGRRWSGTLCWLDSRAALEPAAPDDQELAWAHAEALKLARVLHRDPRAHMVRWRG